MINFKKYSIALTIIFVASLLISWESKNEEIENQFLKLDRPNIILFMVDDMGWQDTSVPFWNEKTPFNLTYETPNMERLANQGVKFTQAYATPVCSPTRVSLMTGMNAARHRVTNWTLHRDVSQPMEDNHNKLSFPKWNVNGISPVSGDPNAVHATTFVQILNNAGYHTIHAGKAHFGAINTPGADPTNLGFDVNIAGHAAGGLGSYLGTDDFGNTESNIWGVPGLEAYHGKDIFLTEALTIEAEKSLEKSLENNKPFYLYMSHYAIHTPIMGDNRFIQKYIDKGLEPIEAKYATLIEGMDKSLGDLMDFVEEKKIADNTIIIFMSDNGGLSALARDGEAHTHNRPLSSGKGSVHEGGIREPMIVKWPGVTEQNSHTDDFVIIEDFFPTILEMAQISNYETVQTIDGRSFTSILKGESEVSERSLFWHYPNEWGPSGPGIGATSTIRKGDWKLVYYHIDSSYELFNIKNDIGETTNLASKEKEILEVLSSELGDYLRSVNAQMPAIKTTGQQVPWPDNQDVLNKVLLP